MNEDLLSTRSIDRYRTSSDASHFQLIPSAFAIPKDLADVAELFSYATANRTSVTFRSGGTSLSGQGVSDAILVDSRRHFRKIEVLDDGARVKVQPGATVRAVNARLARFGRKLGPDPASEIAATIGGVIANNSSGMACGIIDNTYQTLQSATVVLYNGTIINTADPDCDSQLMSAVPEIYETLTMIKADLKNNPNLLGEIRRQYQIKNTMGYGLNSFADFESITEILLHLMIGSEGTLGFVSEAIFRTVPLLKKSATCLLIFENIGSATQALAELITSNPATIELMDGASLRAGKVDLDGVIPTDHVALLVEYQAVDDQQLEIMITVANSVFAKLPTVNTPILSTDQQVRESLWHIRKGLYAAVAGARSPGTTALLEDIAVPVDQLEVTCSGLQRLFLTHGYSDAVIFGHAKDGNLHFLVCEDFANPIKAERYRLFTEDMVELVLSKNGSLKAEHGTGRMMAPFVERQFGPELYAIMVKIKSVFDPSNVLNPGVLISSDALSHMRNIKSTPEIEAIANNCVECGYCEPICPSKDLTTTPRQRIVIRRAISSAYEGGNSELYNELVKDSQYEVVETCAVDGLCESACPVGINTGTLVRELRFDRLGAIYSGFWNQSANRWGKQVRTVAGLLNISAKIPNVFIELINRLARTLLGTEKIPLWSSDLPKGGKARTPHPNESASFVFFTSCIATMFSSDSSDSLKSLADKAGLAYTIPANINDLCCATPWKSKGMKIGYQSMINKTYLSLMTASDNGRIPIVCENSSCSEGLIKAISEMPNTPLRIIDSVDFAAKYLLPKLTIATKLNSVALHPTCSSTLLGSNRNLEHLANAISVKVTTPFDWGCCAFAGDRGMLHPELTASATAAEATALNDQQFDAYLSTNLTCEVAMSRATKQKYEHILCQLDQLSKPKT